MAVPASPLNRDQEIVDTLSLRTVPGAVDFLFAELALLPEITVIARRPDGLDIQIRGSLASLAAVRYFTSLGVMLGREPVKRLKESAHSGVLAAIAGQLSFRVGQLGDQRWSRRDELVELGWVNSAGNWDVNLEPDGEETLAQIGALHYTQRFGDMRRAPASTNPVVAAAMVRLAKIESGQTILDPVCGAGTLLVTGSEMAEPGPVLGSDHDRRWIQATSDNLVDRGQSAVLWRGDARFVPLQSASVDRIISNLPFGKRVGSHLGNKTLYPAVLGEAARLLTRKGRAVMLTEDKRLFVDTVQRTRGLRIIKEITFSTGGAHPSAYVVTTRRTR